MCVRKKEYIVMEYKEGIKFHSPLMPFTPSSPLSLSLLPLSLLPLLPSMKGSLWFRFVQRRSLNHNSSREANMFIWKETKDACIFPKFFSPFFGVEASRKTGAKEQNVSPIFI